MTILKQREEITEETVTDGEDNKIGSFLSLAEQEGFLEMEPDNRKSAYRWIHDKVQEAAMSLVPSEELPTLKAQVGRILVNKLDDLDLNSYIFTVVSLLHEGDMLGEEEERIQLASLSLQAAKKAADQSAFESADKYATIGVEALPANRWSHFYDLTLDLYWERRSLN